MGSQIWCLPEDRLLLRRSFADALPNDDRSCGYAHFDLQPLAGRKQELPHLRNNLQPCPHGAFSIVFVSLRITEVDQQPIPHESADVATEMLDHGSACIFKPAYDAA
jgi:hypothetical protein